MYRPHPREGGSIMIIVAVAMMVLIAFVGLVVDGGELTSQVRISQNAADAAGLAAAWEWADGGQSFVSSNALATIVAAKNGIPTSDLTLRYLDSRHRVTNSPAAVQYVDADVLHVFGTLFLPIINITSASATAHAEVQVVNDPYACVICSLSSHAAGALTVGSAVTISGGSTVVNSDSATALTVSGNLNDATGVGVVGGVSGSSYVSPSPTTGIAPVDDPLASVAEPTLSLYGGCSVHPAMSGNGPFPPGIYAGASANGNTNITLDGAAAGWCGMRGVFVFTGPISMSGNSVLSTTNGAMIFLTCSTFPTSYCGGSAASTGTCSNAGAAGATLFEGGSATTQWSASPGYGGPYAGMAIFADRCNKPAVGTSLVNYSGSGNSGNSNLSGTIYSALGHVTFGGNETWSMSARIVADTISLAVPMTNAFSSNTNYTPKTKLLLVQ